MSLTSSPLSSGRIRTDIQALRTLAVTLVVLFHLWPNRISGGFIGVDVFFVISGFLITKHILHEVIEQRFTVTGFWARRIKRLLPASFTVLVATAFAIVVLAPVSLWSQWLGEVQSAVFYFQNWNLAGAAVDYLALANQASPVQHFWSLSTEEQFYFFWPLIVAAALLLTSRAMKPTASNRKTLLLLFSTVTAASLAYSIYLSNVDPAVAYFSTPVRAWEFGFGAIAAFIPAIKGNSLKASIAAIGLIGIAASALLITNQTTFPGLVAILPTLGTVLVIIAAVEAGVLSRILAWRPIQWIGKKSYAIYLWHWPILIFVPYVTYTALTLPQKLLIVSATLLLAGFTERFIEQPMAKIQPTKIKVFALTATTSVLIASLSGLAINLGNQRIAEELTFGKAGAVATHECFGASARLLTDARCEDSELVGVYPALGVAASDTPVLPEGCFSVTREQIEATYCELGSKEGRIRVAAVGDSHLAQFSGALNVLALRNNWKLDMYAKGGCPFSYAVRKHDALLTKNCPLWVSNVSEQLKKEKYDIVITSQRSGVDWVGGDSQAVSGLSKLWRELVDSGNRIIAIKDNPNPGQNNVACLLTGADCKFERSRALRFDPQLDASTSNPSVKLINFDEVYCQSTQCLPVIGNAVVYRDDNHLTDTFARTLAPAIEAEILSALTGK